MYINVLLPLSGFQVEYEIGGGRPYSKLDNLVLQAINEGATTVKALEEIFHLPSRLLIEILVTLTKAGWIAVSTASGGGFTMTPQGHAALKSGTMPDFLIVRRETGKVFMERMTGKLIPQNEISYDSTTKLENEGIWHKVHEIQANFYENRVDEGQVQHLLRRGRNEWIRWIGRPWMFSKAPHWLLVDVDLENKQVFGLPERWRASLENLLLEEAKKAARSGQNLLREKFSEMSSQKHQPDETTDLPGVYSTQIELSDVLFTHHQHIERLRAVLTEEAKSTVLIASAFLNTAYLEQEIRGWLLEALHRGVHVDLLWGYSASHAKQSEKVALKWLGKVRKEAGRSSGKLRFNEAPTDSHAKLLIYDTDAGYRAYVGSHNWLSTATTIQDALHGNNVTVGLHHPGLVADLCRSVAALSDRAKPLSDLPNRWRRLAGELEQETLKLDDEGKKVDTPDSQCKVRIIRDQEHEELMREYLRNVKSRCAVVSHRIGPKAPIRLASLEEREYSEEFALMVQYDKSSLSQNEQAALRQKVKGANGGVLREQGGLHSKVIVADNKAIVSSYNFLSADPFDKAKKAGEVGVVIEGGRVPDRLWDVFGLHR